MKTQIRFTELEAIYRRWQGKEGIGQRFGQFLCNVMQWHNPGLFYADWFYLTSDFSLYGIEVIY